MIAVDTSILVRAHRSELPRHRECVTWLKRLVGGDSPWALPVFCLGEFIRVTTHPRVFARPSTLTEAIEALNALTEQPSTRVLLPGVDYSSMFADCIEEADARGNLAFDAQIVAVCRENGVQRLLTLDRDFSRWKGLKLELPTHAPD